MAGWDANTKLLCHFNGTTGQKPNAETGQTITYAGTAAVSSATTEPLTNPPDTAALLLDGDSDYVTVPDSADWDFGTGDFTIDFWVNFNSTAATSCQVLLATLTEGIYIERTSTAFRAYLKSGSASITGTSTVNTGTWYHIALVRTGSIAKLFQDGTQIGLDYTSGDNFNAISAVYIGGENVYGSYTNGYIDEFRISNVARWTTTFTRPTDEYSQSTNATGMMTTRTGWWGDL